MTFFYYKRSLNISHRCLTAYESLSRHVFVELVFMLAFHGKGKKIVYFSRYVSNKLSERCHLYLCSLQSEKTSCAT